MGGPSYEVTFAPNGLVTWRGCAFGEPVEERSGTADPDVFAELADLCDRLRVQDWADLRIGDFMVCDLSSTVLTVVAMDGSTTIGAREGSCDPPGMLELVDQIEVHLVALGWMPSD